MEQLKPKPKTSSKNHDALRRRASSTDDVSESQRPLVSDLSNLSELAASDSSEQRIPSEHSLTLELAKEKIAESVQQLGDVCIDALDRLLTKLVDKNINESQRARAGISTSILDGISAKSKMLFNGAAGNVSESMTENQRPSSSNDTFDQTLTDIQSNLDACSKTVPDDDFSLASAFASMLNVGHQLLEDIHQSHGSKKSETCDTLARPSGLYKLANPASTTDKTNVPSYSSRNILNTVEQHVSDLQSRRTSSGPEDVFGSSTARWRELDRAMELIVVLCREKDPSCAASIQLSTTSSSLPVYGKIYDDGHHLGGDTNRVDLKPGEVVKEPRSPANPSDDLFGVIIAIHRVHEVTPRFNNQRVSLSDKQERAIAAASLSKAIVRLSKGRFEEQRADADGKMKSEKIDAMFDLIVGANKNNMEDQRVLLTTNQTKTIELARMSKHLDKAEKARMENQEWQSPSQIRHADMTKLNIKLQELQKPDMDKHQRYTLSVDKERDMFMSNLMNKVNRISRSRMDGQSADSADRRREMRFSEVEKIIERMSEGRLHDQSSSMKGSYLEKKTHPPSAIALTDVLRRGGPLNSVGGNKLSRQPSASSDPNILRTSLYCT